MSRSTIGGIVGAVIGYYVGGPTGAARGWAIGSFVGASTMSGPNQIGPRLNDLQAEAIEYGSDIPRVYGRARIAGFRIWQRDIREQANEEDSGGKGGGGGATVTTFTYYGTFAIALCEGPIIGIRKIWADSDLIYNLGDTSDLETILASNRAAAGISIYTGTSTQQPDSLIQATEGAANTPAYRNTAYIVFDDFPLEKYGNRIPNITAEVIGAGSQQFVGELPTFDISLPKFGTNPSLTVDGFDGAKFKIVESAGTKDAYSIGFPEQYRLSDVTISGVISNLGSITGYSVTNYPIQESEKEYEEVEGLMQVSFSDKLTTMRDNLVCAGIYDGVPVLMIEDISSYKINEARAVGNTSITTTNKIGYGVGRANANYIQPTGPVESGATISGQDLGDLLIDYGAGDEYITVAAGNIDSKSSAGNAIYIFTSPDTSGPSFTSTKYYRLEISGGVWSVTEDGSCSFSNYEINQNGCIENGKCVLEDDSHVWGTSNRELSSTHHITMLEKSGNAFIKYSTRAATFPNAAAITGASTQRVSCMWANSGIMLMTTGSDLEPDDFPLTVHPFSRSKSISLSPPQLLSVVSDICTRAGLEASDIDVTELTDTVDGYIVSRNISARAAIEPLQRAYLFDGAEIDGKIKFVKRGNSSVVTIPQDDLGVGELGFGMPQLTTQRQQDSELPSEINVSYISSTRDYETASQPSQRINKNVENVVTQELPIVLSDDRGVQLADITLYNAWTEREKFNFNLTMEYIDRNPTDVVTVQYGSQSRVVRLTKISYGDWLECEAVSEDSTIYSSDATAEEDDYTDQVVGLTGPTRVEYMDIPLLRNQDNSAGLYYAICGFFSAWTGATIFKSLDGGITYNSVESFFTAGTIGRATTTLATADPELWDRTNTLTVSLTNGTFSSTTEDGAIQGSNYLLVGSEIINFVNATLNADGTYTLDTFIRGRRGTEWAAGSHSSSEDVVLLNENIINRFEAIVGTARTYKAVTIGTFIDEADAEDFTNTGVSLKPFSPVLISGTRDGSNNLTGDFTRRSRYITGPLWTPPLFEASESYEVDVMDGSTVVRTISTSTTDFTYSAADQTTDFGSTQSSIEVNIYQLSGTVGRGYSGNASI